jgi:hypothetical protein
LSQIPNWYELNHLNFHHRYFNPFSFHAVLNFFVHHVFHIVNHFHQFHLNQIHDWHDLKALPLMASCARLGLAVRGSKSSENG